MGRIQSSVGLITGIPIEETVNKLMAIAARPKDLLTERTKSVDAERLAITHLTSLVLAFEFEVNRLSSADVFQTKTVTSSDANSLRATLTGNGTPPDGTYKFRPLQTASSHQLASSSFDDLSALTEAGTLTFGFGGFVDKGIALAELNAGGGVSRGSIRITDRAGDSAEIDLRLARTVDDVLSVINHNGGAAVSAEINGDSIRLTDRSGGSGNLKVQEIGGGTTALDLGLFGINVAANEATGADIFTLHGSTKLASLNDGAGVALAAGNDLTITLADGTTLDVDLGTAETLADVLDVLNSAGPSKLQAVIAADGNRLELTDLTSGGSAFSVASVGTGTAAESLGLTVEAGGDTITGSRLTSGLRDSLVSSLRGGKGLSALGEIDITNRNNVTSTVDLAAAETLAEIVAAINQQATGVTAAINSARNGIVLTDTTGGTASNLIVADGDSRESASALGLNVDEAVTAVNSGSLDRHQIGRGTLLSSLNGGKGIDVADFVIIDSSGKSGGVDLNTPGNEAKTVGDVLDRINALTNANVEARINDAGDGILLIDHAGGDGTLRVREVGRHTAAADLRLLSPVVEQQIDNVTRQTIDGTTRKTIDLSGLNDPGATIALSSLNGGHGVAQGSFRITDRSGTSAVVVLTPASGTFNTVADVLDAINATNIDVEARINARGNGILLVATGVGNETLSVEDLSGGTTAADLGLAGEAESAVVDNTTTQAIDGAGKFSKSATLSGLDALAKRINLLKAGVTANTVFDGSGYRLVLTADETGAGSEFLVDGLDAGLTFEQLSPARDALIEFGGVGPGTGVLLASPDNSFDELIPGINITSVAPVKESVSVSVTKSKANIVSAVQDFVDAFNSIRDNLDAVTSFNEEDLTTGILFGTTAAIRVESDLTRVLSGRFAGVGRFASLEAIGIGFSDGGKLELNKTKLEEAVADDPASVETLFTHRTLGLAAKLKTAIEQLAGKGNSVLASRAESLADIIEISRERITKMDERLERQRERLLTEFARLEATVSSLQQNLTALSALQILPPITRTTSSRQ